MIKDGKKLSKAAFVLSLIAVVLAAVVNLGGMEVVLGLAGTQWILIAIVLAVYAVYLDNCSCLPENK